MGDEGDEDDDKEVVQDGQGAAKKKKARKKKKKPKESEEQAEQPGTDVDDHGDQGCADAWDAMPKEWVDITGVCGLAVKGMGLGEMIESPHFRLVDAMSAIEIMDPKMDSGFQSTEDMTVDKAVDAGILTTSLSHEDMLAIWDHLLMYYLMWLEGHTIVQTCFSCLYLQDLERHVKPMPLMSAFIDAFLAACRRANGAVLNAGIFDDEDFVPSMFGVDLYKCAVASEPSEVAERLKAERKLLAKSPSEPAGALAHRLEFIEHYMLALSDLVDEQPTSGGAGGARRTQQSARDRLGKCIGLLDRLKQTARKADASTDVLRCFDASVNKRLLVPGPPRSVQPITDPQLAFDAWTSHVHELQLCGGLTERPLAELLQGAITYKDEPNVLPRSVAQLCVSEEGLVRRLMLDSLALVLFPAEALQHCKKATDAFLWRCESLFAHLLKLAHANAARRYRRLAHVFPDFNTLQSEAWLLDEELRKTFGANLRHPRPCWVWIMEHCLQAMISKLLLGFELDLYDQSEFHMIYWYVEYLFGLRIYNLNEVYHAKEQPTGGGSKPKKGARKDQQPKNLQGGLRPRNPPPLLLLLEATRSTARGLFRLLAFCVRRQMIKAPSCGGLERRFVLRFRSLEHFRLPHLPSFQDFEQSSASTHAPLESQSRAVLDAAAASLTEGAQFLDKMTAAKGSSEEPQPVFEDAKTLKRVVVANQLAITKLSRLLESGQCRGQTSIVAALTHHPHLASVQVHVSETGAAGAAGGQKAAPGPAAGGGAKPVVEGQ